MHELIKNILKESEENIDDFFKPKNLKSREEKLRKELEFKCQEIFHMSVDELKNIYFSFYDQLDEPEKTKAKNNWDIEFAMKHSIPKTISDAIIKGFHWVVGSSGSAYYWNKIYKKYKQDK